MPDPPSDEDRAVSDCFGQAAGKDEGSYTTLEKHNSISLLISDDFINDMVNTLRLGPS